MILRHDIVIERLQLRIATHRFTIIKARANLTTNGSPFRRNAILCQRDSIVAGRVAITSEVSRGVAKFLVCAGAVIATE